MEKNRISLKIGGRQYPVKAEESIDYLFTLGVYVDRAIADVLRKEPSLSTEEAAVVAALNIADELLKLKKSLGLESGGNSFAKEEQRPGGYGKR